MGGHGLWREIGTQRCAGAFLPAGRRGAQFVDDYGSGYVAETLKKNPNDSFLLLSAERGVAKAADSLFLCANDGIPVESRNCSIPAEITVEIKKSWL